MLELFYWEKINIFFKIDMSCVNNYKAPHTKRIFFFLKFSSRYFNHLNKIFAIKIDKDKINVIVLATMSELFIMINP